MLKPGILIVDYGSQVTHLIARRIRTLQIYCEVVTYDKASKFLKEHASHITAVILSGGPCTVSSADAPSVPDGLFSYSIPILGICYGQQLIASYFGGVVERMAHSEFGRTELTLHNDHILFKGIVPKREHLQVWMSHGDSVTRLPDGFIKLASTPRDPHAVFAHPNRPIFGVQFHPELEHTEHGMLLLKNFLFEISGCKVSWQISSYAKELESKLLEEVPSEGKILCALSGGVDSTVTAVLLNRIFKDRVICVYVDHGLMRSAESEEVVSLFRSHFNIPLMHLKKQEMFLNALKGVTDPELKRKRIGHLFIKIFEEVAKVESIKFLAQGTLYPDTIESVSSNGSATQVIKSHHNVGGLPENMCLELIEPLRYLFKDEVRHLGKTLGIPEAFVKRHPFPGPGLAIRCIGEVTVERLHLIRQADVIFLEEIKKANLYDQIWQAFAGLLPVNTVGVMGDSRTYEAVCFLRAVTSNDGMSADTYPFEAEFLAKVTNRIINEVRGINRVVYDTTSKPPGTIEWE